MSATTEQPMLRGVYWRCPDCSAAVVVTIPNPLGWLSAALGLDTYDVLDFGCLPATELAKSEALVEDHEDGHLLWRDFDAGTA